MLGLKTLSDICMLRDCRHLHEEGLSPLTAFDSRGLCALLREYLKIGPLGVPVLESTQ
jgi:hypothetical protein